MKSTKADLSAQLKKRVFDPKNRQEVSHAVHELVADEDERKKLLRATHDERVAVLKKNGYKFKK